MYALTIFSRRFAAASSGVPLSQSQTLVIKMLNRILKTFVTDWFTIGAVFAVLWLIAEAAINELK
jgi:hypothetical protein